MVELVGGVGKNLMTMEIKFQMTKE